VLTVTEQFLDTNLLRALREGTSALPADLGKLRGYLRMIGALLEERACELEPSWEQACAAAAEIATLQDLEISVAERAIGVRAESLEQVRAKLAIWRALASTGEDRDLRSPHNRLVLSIEADLERLSSGPR
jgi:hypothetical protein